MIKFSYTIISRRKELDKYITVSQYATEEITEKKSRFIAYMTHIESKEEAEEFISGIKKKHYDARHNVYAYILSSGEKKYSDDGEPSKTGGFPVLEMLEKECITDVVCVVTRYFGGTLLGVGGLIRAYTLAAKNALDAAGKKEKKMCHILKVSVPYPDFDSFVHLTEENGVETVMKEYSENIYLTLSSPIDITDNYINKVTEHFNGKITLSITDTVLN